MENIAKLQDYISDYLDKDLSKFYTFKVWKDLLVLLRKDPKSLEAIKLFERYGVALKVRRIFIDVKASPEDWMPTLSIEYEWMLDSVAVGLRVIIVKNKVLYVQVIDMFSTFEKYGEEYDYVKKFEKTVVLMTALRG